MKKFIFISLSLCLLLTVKTSFGQISVKDSAVSFGMFSGHYSVMFPGDDLKLKYGTNSNIGASFNFKLKSNWEFGIEYNFLFGNEVKHEDSLFRAIATKENTLIDVGGYVSEYFLYERGFYSAVKLGKIFPLPFTNPNSGLYVNLGLGYLQHKTRIENPGLSTVQIVGDYKKLYDQLTGGLATSQFIGYKHFGNNRLANFYIGAEFTQAWTKSLRSYNMYTMSSEQQSFYDSAWGLKFGWIIPLYKRVPKQYYYN